MVSWYGHVLRKEDNDWVKKCLEYEVEGARPRGRPKKTWREIVEKDYKARGLNREDAMDRSRWRKQIGMIDDHDECEWVNVSSGTGSPGGKNPWRSKNSCVCVLCGMEITDLPLVISMKIANLLVPLLFLTVGIVCEH